MKKTNKSTKPAIKVRDLKPGTDPKGGLKIQLKEIYVSSVQEAGREKP